MLNKKLKLIILYLLSGHIFHLNCLLYRNKILSVNSKYYNSTNCSVSCVKLTFIPSLIWLIFHTCEVKTVNEIKRENNIP